MTEKRPPIYLYTDGSSRGNPGPGGWGVVLVCGNLRKELSGGEASTTNNRMELTAVIEGLKAIKWKDATVHIWSDSSYVVNAIEKGWLAQWLANDLTSKTRTRRKKPTRSFGESMCGARKAWTFISTGLKATPVILRMNGATP